MFGVQDSYKDEAKEFAVAQPVAREVHSTLEDSQTWLRV